MIHPPEKLDPDLQSLLSCGTRTVLCASPSLAIRPIASTPVILACPSSSFGVPIYIKYTQSIHPLPRTLEATSQAAAGVILETRQAEH